MWKLLILILALVFILFPADNAYAAPSTVADFSEIPTIDKMPKGINYIPEDTIIWMKDKETGHEKIEFTRVSGNSFNCRVIDKSIQPDIKNSYPVKLYTIKDKLTEDDKLAMGDSFEYALRLGIWKEVTPNEATLSSNLIDLTKGNTVNLEIINTKKPYVLAFGNTITYNAGTDLITVTSNTTDLFEDIYLADVAGGWGQVTKQGSHQYYFQAGIVIGDGSTVVITSDILADVTFWDSGIPAFKYLETKANATISLGLVASAINKTTLRGCVIRATSPSVGVGYLFYGAGTQNLYSCDIKVHDNTYVYNLNNVWNCGFDDYPFIETGSTGDMDKLVLSYSRLRMPQDTGATVNNVFSSSGTYFIYVGSINGASSTISNFTGITTGAYSHLLQNSQNKTYYCIDFDINKWNMQLIGGSINPTSIYRQYTMNIKVVDQDGNPIENAIVSLNDANDDNVFSVSTAADGTIVEQVVDYQLFYVTASVATTTYSPHTLTVTADNFFFETLIFDVDKPTDLIIAGVNMEEVATAIDSLTASVLSAVDDSLAFGIIIILMLGLAGLAYWRGDRPLFFFSGIAFMIYGFAYATNSIWYSILLVLAGFFLCARAFTQRGMDKWQR